VKKSKEQPKKPGLMSTLPKNEGERLEIMINLTMRAANRNGNDQTMLNQATRLRAQLESWKQSNRQ